MARLGSGSGTPDPVKASRILSAFGPLSRTTPIAPAPGPDDTTVVEGEISRYVLAQDTGGAIKGANRFDTFWGAGAEARRIAGGMSGRGQALLLLPKGTVERLNQPR